MMVDIAERAGQIADEEIGKLDDEETVLFGRDDHVFDGFTYQVRAIAVRTALRLIGERMGSRSPKADVHIE